ncbi:MAG: glycosyltransferase, partial [bacterium]|nr:glycosyltransferase [bacterium]
VFWMLFLDNLPVVRQFFPAYHKRNQSFFQKERNVDWIQGAFLCFRSELVQRVGLFDEKIFLYAEDVDWCWRARRKGFRAVFTPVGQIRHLGQGSSGFSPHRAIRGELEVIPYLYKKFYGRAAAWFILALLVFGSLLRIAVFGIIQRRRDLASAYVGYLTRVSLS